MRLKRFGFAAGAALFVVSGAFAQTTAPATPDAGAAAATAADGAATKVKAKVKPKAAAEAGKTAKPKKLPFLTVVVKNGRSASLVLLTATMSGGNGDPVKVIGSLASGKSATAHLAHEKDCLFDLHGDYDDGQSTEVSGVDLCKDKKINLTD
jgi:hypothetical protein